MTIIAIDALPEFVPETGKSGTTYLANTLASAQLLTQALAFAQLAHWDGCNLGGTPWDERKFTVAVTNLAIQRLVIHDRLPAIVTEVLSGCRREISPQQQRSRKRV